MKNMTPEQKQMIKKIKAEANKEITKIFSMTFDQELRNKRFLEVKKIEQDSINKVLAI